MMFAATTAPLPLDADPANDATLRAAYARCHLRMPFEVAIRIPALDRCLRNVAEARVRRARVNRRPGA